MSNNVASAGGSASGSASGSGLFVYDERRDTYDLNTRILATAVICLACVVVLMIFLHLYVRQALLGRHHAGRHRTPAAASHLLRFYMSDPVGHDDPAGHVGLDPAAISALPTLPYRAHADGGEPSECAICLGAVEEEEVVRVMPGCKHTFHVGCIDVWLGSYSTCPVCRTGVEPPPAVTQAAAPPSQEGTSSGSKEPGSASSRFGSFRRMLTWERSSTGRRAQGEGMEDLERQ